MNWTEGNLSRHSRGKQRNELLARQKQHFAKVRNNLLKGGAKKSPISISFLGSRHSPATRRQDDSPDIQDRPAPRSPLVETRKRSRTLQDDPQSQSSILEKKRRLLGKADWAGLDLQQPIDISFPGRTQAAIGSRWSKGKYPVAYSRPVQKHRDTRDSNRFEVPRPINTHPLRIQIGSQEVQPSWGVTSQPSTKRYSLPPRLLVSSSLRSTTISSPAPSHARQLYVTTESSNGGASQKYERERGVIARGHGDIYLKPPYPEAPVRPPRRLPHRPPIQEEPTHVAYASSVIHEPAPLRADDFLVLSWCPSSSNCYSSSDTGSMQVEIERPSRPVPPLHDEDQERWKQLVMSSSDTLPDISSVNSHFEIPQIIPSTSASSSHFQRRLPSYDVSSELELNPSDQNFDPFTIRQEEEDMQIKVQLEDQFEAQPQHQHEPQPQLDLQSQPKPDLQPDLQPEAEEVGDQLLKQQQTVNQAPRDIQPVDDNSAWMKFAFDSDSDEIGEKAFEEAVHQAAAELSRQSSPSIIDGAESVGIHEANTSSGNEELHGEIDPPETSSDSHMATQGTMISESVTSNVATVGSTNETDSESQFRFAKPTSFVGKFVNPNINAQGPPLLSQGGGKKRRRSKKKAIDGRTNIRRLPDFDGDPIEEFEED